MKSPNRRPAYLSAYHTRKLDELIGKTQKMLESCSLCPRKCRVNRQNYEKGFCRTGKRAKVYSYLAHHGEEPPISGQNGSGTIFFCACNMSCCYCQNYEFSQMDKGKEVEPEELADFMLRLQEKGCHNINLVTPTHILPQILSALKIAISKGLRIPVVYNTSGYELPQIIKLLDGIVDIYLVDMRYSDEKNGFKYSCAPDYPKYNQATVKEMYRQVGKDGLIIRHLVLPKDISGTGKIMHFIKDELSTDISISLMSQYMPCFNAVKYPELSSRITLDEYEKAVEIMHKEGLYQGWIQESHGLAKFAGTNIKSCLNP